MRRHLPCLTLIPASAPTPERNQNEQVRHVPTLTLQSPRRSVGGTLGALGAIVAPGSSYAETRLGPPSADCKQYTFNGPLTVTHSNGWTLEAFLQGGDPRVGTNDEAHAWHGGGGRMQGPLIASINGRVLNLEVAWNNGSHGVYSGEIDNNGCAHGISRDIKNPGVTATFDSKTTFLCLIDVAPPPPPPPPVVPDDPKPDPEPAPGVAMVKVTEHTDVYDRPNEDPDNPAEYLGILEAGNWVELVGGSCQLQAWCEVKGDAVPGGQGFVWGALAPLVTVATASVVGGTFATNHCL